MIIAPRNRTSNNLQFHYNRKVQPHTAPIMPNIFDETSIVALWIKAFADDFLGPYVVQYGSTCLDMEEIAFKM